MRSNPIVLAAEAMVVMAVVVLLTSAIAVRAQQATIYDRNGKVLGRAVIDSQGTTTTYDAAGRVVSRESPTDTKKPRDCPFRLHCFEPPMY